MIGYKLYKIVMKGYYEEARGEYRCRSTRSSPWEYTEMISQLRVPVVI